MINDSQTPSFSDDEEMKIWIDSVMADFRDGEASSEDIESLRNLLTHNAAARQAYIEANNLSGMLETTTPQRAQNQIQPLPKKSLRSHQLWVMSGIAAVLVAGIWLLMKPTPPEANAEGHAIALLSTSHEAVWVGTQPDDETDLNKSALELQSGIAEIEFLNGASLVLEGPCKLDIVDGNTVRLVSGKLWARCPPTAIGFEVLAPGGHRVVDLGTEFGVGIGASGSTDVHVFDGEVEVFPNEQDKQAILAGSAIQLVPGAESISFDANIDQFTSPEELQRERWRVHHANLLKHKDLQLYYNFDSPGSEVRDHSGNSIAGRASGALSVGGRMPGGKALLFEAPDDKVALDFGELTFEDGFTIAMWIKPDQPNKSHATLINSNGFDPGDIHFQFSQGGRLLGAVSDIADFGTRSTGLINFNEWQFVTMSWNLNTGRAKFFHNGRRFESILRKPRQGTPESVAKFGKCQIGSWGDPTIGHQRNFVGRIDEVMVFSKVLAPAEIRELYQASRP